MARLDAIAAVFEALLHLLSDGYAAVLAAGAAEGYGEIAFAFLDVVREEEFEHFGCFGEELLGLRKAHDVAGDFLIFACQLAELGDEVWVREEAHIEDEISVGGHTVFEAEAGCGDSEIALTCCAAALFKLRVDVGAQLMHVEFCGFERDICDVADGVEAFAFCADGIDHCFFTAEGMRSAGFAEAPDEGIVCGVEEEDARGQDFAHLFQDGGKAIETAPFANVDYERGAGDFG